MKYSCNLIFILIVRLLKRAGFCDSQGLLDFVKSIINMYKEVYGRNRREKERERESSKEG